MRYFILSFVSFLLSFSAFAQDRMITVYETSLPYTEQQMFYSGTGNELEKSRISELWNQGHRITGVAYTDLGWYVTMSKNSGYTMQTYFYEDGDASDWVQEKYDEGYYITSFAGSPEKWMIVMSQGTGYTDQVSLGGDPRKGIDKLEDYWYYGYQITAASYSGDGSWNVIMSLGNIPTYDQSIYMLANEAEVSAKARELWDSGYNIQLLQGSDMGFLLVAGKYKENNDRAQSFVQNSTDIIAVTEDKWENGFVISYIGGGYDDSEYYY